MDHRRLLSLYALLALFLIATSSPLYAEPPPSVRAVLDAPVDAVWDATIESLRDAGYKVREEHRVEGIISARRPISGCCGALSPARGTRCAEPVLWLNT
jgi:hypothetical protein